MKRQATAQEWLDINEAILEVIALAQYQLRRSEILLETRLGHDLRSSAATGCTAAGAASI